MFKSFLLLLLVGMVASCSGNDDSNDTIVVDFQDNDGDGVANTIEQNAGTDPNDGCSFTLSQQEFSKTTEAWRGQDCDGDGVTNGEEQAEGTDPLNPTDFLGGGSDLVSNTRYNANGTLIRKANYEANGSRIKEVNCSQEKGLPNQATRTTFYEPQQLQAVEYSYE